MRRHKQHSAVPWAGCSTHDDDLGRLAQHLQCLLSGLQGRSASQSRVHGGQIRSSRVGTFPIIYLVSTAHTGHRQGNHTHTHTGHSNTCTHTHTHTGQVPPLQGMCLCAQSTSRRAISSLLPRPRFTTSDCLLCGLEPHKASRGGGIISPSAFFPRWVRLKTPKP